MAETSGKTDNIFYLIKFFSEQAHADSFRKGELFLNRLSYFRKIEADQENTGGRHDSNEAVALWAQPYDVVLSLDVPGIGAIEIREKDLAGPVSMSFQYHDNLHLFCMYAVRVKGYGIIDGRLDMTESDIADVQAQLKIDERCFQFGKFAVIVPAVKFLDQLAVTLREAKYNCVGRLVEYYDEETFHGSIEWKDIPFKKQKAYSYQSEFRICVTPKADGDDPLILNIGDMTDFTATVEASSLNDHFRITVEPAPSSEPPQHLENARQASDLESLKSGSQPKRRRPWPRAPRGK